MHLNERNFIFPNNNFQDLVNNIRYIKDNHSQKIFLLYGNLGAGKTTFVQNFFKEHLIQSPTYVFYKEYSNLWHFDLYLYKDKMDYHILFEAFFSEKYVVIEWAEYLPGEVLKTIEKMFINIEFINNISRYMHIF
jgi:tRNA threonylcarbamoyl adenosine modification protein YjeE